MRARLALAALVTLGCVTLLCAPPALAQYESPKLAAVASVFAMEPVKVTCSEHGEDSILDFEAWGYVYLAVPEVHMSTYLCHAAENVTSDAYGLSLRAIAVLVLTHESYHLRTVWGGRGDEALVECKAIRHFRYSAQMLGASPELATQLRVYALAFHWRLAARHPAYNLAGCTVPRP
jgi:hypothetical protein